MRYKGNRPSGLILRWSMAAALGVAVAAQAVPAFADEPEQPERDAQARPVRPRGPGPHGRTGRRQMPPEFRERFDSDDIKELIDVVRVWRMKRELDLSEEQALKLLMATDAHREAVSRMREQQQRVIDELREALDERKGREEIEKLIERIDAIDVQLMRAEQEHRQKLMAELSFEQKAKFYEFRPRFERDVWRAIKRIMERRRSAAEAEPSEDNGNERAGRGRRQNADE